MEYRAGENHPGAVVAKQIRRLREAQGLSQAELAEKLGVPQATVSRLERGSRGISVADCLALALALNTSPANLLTPSDSNERLAISRDVVVDGSTARQWIGGQKPLREQDARAFWSSLSQREWELRESAEVAPLVAAMHYYFNAALDQSIDDMTAGLDDIIHIATGIRMRLQRILDKVDEEGGR